MAEIWDEAKPSGGRNPLLGDDDIREFKRAVRERLAADHEAAATESPAFGDSGSVIGFHKQITLTERSADPTTGANQAAVYAKEAGGVTEIFMRPESAGTVKQLTRGGLQKLNTLPFSDGTNDIAFPTNGMAAAKFMLGDSNTITWFYLNTAPPGWKVTVASGDAVLATAGGSAAYNVEGGNWSFAGTWTQPAHSHGLGIGNGTGLPSIGENVRSDGPPWIQVASVSHTHGMQNTNTATAATANTWRPQAYVGKLFQLDTP
jgi:hypothetical protein